MKKTLKINFFIVIIFCVNISCIAQSNVNDSTDCFTFYEYVTKKYPNYRYDLKDSFTKPEYFQSFVNLLQKKIDKNVSYNQAKHCAFDIDTGNDLYRLNLLELDLNKKVVDSLAHELGIFSTKALIGFYYIEHNKKGYLLLSNKMIPAKETFMQELIKCLEIVYYPN